jgi:hypothetical protein
MSKIFWLIISIIIFLSGFARFEDKLLINDSYSSITDGLADTDLYTESYTDSYSDLDKEDTNATSNLLINNFFVNEDTQLSCNGSFLFGEDIIEKDVSVSIDMVASLKKGTLYELKINMERDNEIPTERMKLGYFYVQKDRIYKFDATKGNLKSMLYNETLPEDCVIVCQEEEMKDALGEDEQGWHHYIEVVGDRREYHSYNDEGTTGYYESFTWEKGKGLVNYRSGFGAESDAIELTLK